MVFWHAMLTCFVVIVCACMAGPDRETQVDLQKVQSAAQEKENRPTTQAEEIAHADAMM